MAMIRSIGMNRLSFGFLRSLVNQQNRNISKLQGHEMERDGTLTCTYECFFKRDDIDGWDVRQGLNDLAAFDAVPEPPVIIAALHACRKINDYALTVRFLESVKHKCGPKQKEIYPYILQEIQPTLAELGCDLPEDLCYDKPELFMATRGHLHY